MRTMGYMPTEMELIELSQQINMNRASLRGHLLPWPRRPELFFDKPPARGHLSVSCGLWLNLGPGPWAGQGGVGCALHCLAGGAEWLDGWPDSFLCPQWVAMWILMTLWS